MEPLFRSLISTEEAILAKMKDEQRSTYWLAAKIDKSQSYVYRLLCGKSDRKIKLTQEVLDRINEVFPGCNFTLNLSEYEKLEAAKQSLKDKPLFNDEN